MTIFLVLAAAVVGTRPVVMVAAAGVGVAPVGTLLGALLVGLGHRLRRLSVARRTHRDAARATADLADLVALGLAAGHNVRGSIAAAAPYIHPVLRFQIERALRSSRLHGLAEALRETSGPADELFGVLAGALERGAAAWDAVTAWADERRAVERAETIEAIEKLPVKLLFPLALLVLPGFVLLLLAPAVFGALERFG